jgi:hypothetical protein
MPSEWFFGETRRHQSDGSEIHPVGYPSADAMQGLYQHQKQQAVDTQAASVIHSWIIP